MSGDGAWSDQEQNAVRQRVAALAAEGYRITAYAYALASIGATSVSKEELRFVGCAVLENPCATRSPLPSAPCAVLGCSRGW